MLTDRNRNQNQNGLMCQRERLSFRSCQATSLKEKQPHRARRHRHHKIIMLKTGLQKKENSRLSGHEVSKRKAHPRSLEKPPAREIITKCAVLYRRGRQIARNTEGQTVHYQVARRDPGIESSSKWYWRPLKPECPVAGNDTESGIGKARNSKWRLIKL